MFCFYFSSLDKGLERCEEMILKSQGVEQKEKDLSTYQQALYPKQESLPALLSAMQKKEIETGYVLIQQGDEADKRFFVENGRRAADVIRYNSIV